jgi:hypothetical protein
MVCSCGHNLQGRTKTSGKKKGYRKYYYYTCGGYAMKGKTVCRQYHLPKDVIEGPVFDALTRRVNAMARVDNIRAQVEALLAEHAAPRTNEKRARRRLAELEKSWFEAIGALAAGGGE